MLTVEEIREKIKAIPFVNDMCKGLMLQLTGKQLTIARYLTRELKLQEDGWKDHQIRDLADKINMDLNPVEDGIRFCNTPEDYIEMYKAGNSCMTVGCFSHLNDTARQILNKQNLWPTIWYHYNPHTQGVYLVYKGRPAARTFLITMKGSPWYRGPYPYASPYECSVQINKLLEAKGFAPKPLQFTCEITEEFRVPGVLHEGQYYGPIPNCDDVRKGFKVTFDEKTNDFIYGPQGKTIIADTYPWGGWISQQRC